MLTQFRHAWRSQALKLALLALVISIAGLSSVGFFTDRLTRGLSAQKRVLLGGDIALTSDQRIDARLATPPTDLAIRHTQTLTFLSMVSQDTRLQLASIKAVATHYPLLGELQVHPPLPTANASPIPAPGTVWLSPELMAILGTHVGASLMLGSASFTIAGTVIGEPDRGERWFTLAPRLMLNLSDIDKTGVIVPGSRMRHHYLYTAPTQAAINTWATLLAKRVSANETILSAATYQPGLTRLLQRIQHYLSLSTLLTLLLASVTISIALTQYFKQQIKLIALMRCLGCRFVEMRAYFIRHLMIILAIGCVCGCAVGLAGQWLLSALMASMYAIHLPAPRLTPALWACASGSLIFSGISLPLLLNTQTVSPEYCLRQFNIPMRRVSLIIIAITGMGLLGLLFVYTRNLTLTTLMGGAVALAIAVCFLISHTIIRVLNKTRHLLTLSWQFAIASLFRNRQQTVIELTSLTLILSVLLLTTLVRNDIITSWKNTPATTPNYFMINIEPHVLPELHTFLQRHSIQTTSFHPLIRGRIISLNAIPILQALPETLHVHNALNRALNLSWASEPPPRERIREGQWFSASAEARGEPLVSVEAGLAKQLGLRLGDVLGLQVGSELLQVRIVNLRQVDWRSFSPNFYLLLPKPLLQHFPQTFMTSLFVPESQASVLASLYQQFPTLTLINVAQIANQFTAAVDKLAHAIEFILVFTLAGVILILITHLMLSMRYRQHQHAIIRALGASRRLLQTALVLEFGLLGLLAGLLALGIANALGALFSLQVLNTPYVVSLWIGLWVPLASAMMVALTSLICQRKTLRVSPHQALASE